RNRRRRNGLESAPQQHVQAHRAEHREERADHESRRAAPARRGDGDEREPDPRREHGEDSGEEAVGPAQGLTPPPASPQPPSRGTTSTRTAAIVAPRSAASRQATSTASSDSWPSTTGTRIERYSRAIDSPNWSGARIVTVSGSRRWRPR